MVCVTIGLFNFFVLLTKRSLYTGGITITWLSVDGCPVVRVHVSVNGEAQRVREHSTLPAQSCPVPYWLMGFLETPVRNMVQSVFWLVSACGPCASWHLEELNVDDDIVWQTSHWKSLEKWQHSLLFQQGFRALAHSATATLQFWLVLCALECTYAWVQLWCMCV